MKLVVPTVSEHCHMVHQITNHLHQNKDEWPTNFRKKPWKLVVHPTYGVFYDVKNV